MMSRFRPWQLHLSLIINAGYNSNNEALRAKKRGCTSESYSFKALTRRPRIQFKCFHLLNTKFTSGYSENDTSSNDKLLRSKRLKIRSRFLRPISVDHRVRVTRLMPFARLRELPSRFSFGTMCRYLALISLYRTRTYRFTKGVLSIAIGLVWLDHSAKWCVEYPQFITKHCICRTIS